MNDFVNNVCVAINFVKFFTFTLKRSKQKNADTIVASIDVLQSYFSHSSPILIFRYILHCFVTNSFLCHFTHFFVKMFWP